MTDTTPPAKKPAEVHDAGEKTVRDFNCQALNCSALLSEAEIGLKQLLSGQRITSSDLDKILAN